ncbi:MAG: TetR/AcrR family transcriptional regulator [Verrucomicrobiota bacterium]
MPRPIKYDNSEILETATALFWERGYRGVSIKNLVEETGMLPGSFYLRYGSKEGLFIECVHHYAGLTAMHYEAALQSGSPLEQIESLLKRLESDALKHDDRRVCFMVNSLLEIAPRHPKVFQILRYYLQLSEAWIEQRLEAAKKSGEIRPETDSKALAGCLFGITYAVRIKARTKEKPELLRDYRKTVFAALVDPWRAS